MAVADVKTYLEDLWRLISKLLNSKEGNESQEVILKMETILEEIKNLPEYDKMVDFVESIEKLIGIYKNETDNVESLMKMLSIVSDELRGIRYKFNLFSDPGEYIYWE